MKKNISLHGAYYPNNFGDVLILAIQSNWIKEITGKEVVLPFATEIYRDQIQSSRERGFKGLRNSEKLIYGAGGYLGEPNIKKWLWGFRFFLKHYAPAKYASFKKIKYAVIGTGVGPLTNIFTRKAVVNLSKKSAFLAVRDNESKQYLKKYGVEDDKVFVTADVALSLTKEDLPIESKQKGKKIFENISGPKYGVHIGADIDSPVYGSKIKMLIDECVNFFNKNKHITPVLIIDNNNKAQNKAVNYLKKNIKNDCVVYKHNKDIWETATVLSELDIVITNKLHIGIVAYALGTDCIGFPYHSKTTRFYKQIKQEELCKHILELEKNEATRILNKTLDKEWKAELDNKRSIVQPKLREKALINKDLLRSFLEKH